MIFLKQSPKRYSISIAWDLDVRVLVKIHVFHFNKSCFQLEDALVSGLHKAKIMNIILATVFKHHNVY